MAETMELAVSEEVELLCAGVTALHETGRAGLDETGDTWARLGELMMTGQIDEAKVCELLGI